jgi:YggT family protein
VQDIIQNRLDAAGISGVQSSMTEARLLANLISTIFDMLVLLVFVNSILSFFMSPYHPVKEALDRLVDPMLAPIRRLMPPSGMFDFSPMILIIALQVISILLQSIILSLS